MEKFIFVSVCLVYVPLHTARNITAHPILRKSYVLVVRADSYVKEAVS